MNRAVVFAIVVLLGLGILRQLQQCKKKNPANRFAQGLFGCYMLGNLYYTLLSRITIPAAVLEAKLAKIVFEGFARESALTGAVSGTATQQVQQHGNEIEASIETANLPMLDPTSPYYAMNTFILNVLLYIPLGYLLPVVFPKLRVKAWNVILAGLLLSFATETMQFVFNLGQFDVRDLLCNTMGTVIGTVFYKLLLEKENKTEQ